MAKHPTIPDLDKTRFCLGKCGKKTPHKKLLKTDGLYQVNCYFCNHTGNAVA